MEDNMIVSSEMIGYDSITWTPSEHHPRWSVAGGARENLMTDSEPAPRNFETTRWSVVFRAGQDDKEAEHALGILCQTYWYPLYGYARRQGVGPHDAQDLVQGFLAKVIVNDLFGSADRDKGRLRSYLLRAMQRYIRDERDKARAEKRGGGAPLVSIDAEWAEQCYGEESADERTPDQAYDREWAMAVLNNALAKVSDEWTAKGKGELFGQLRPWLSMDEEETSYQELGAKIGMTEGTAKVTVHRLRARYRELIRKEIRRTLPDDESVENELQVLTEALS
jgi:RNA polymerase sigma-70 factor (ECF subfamily)